MRRRQALLMKQKLDEKKIETIERKEQLREDTDVKKTKGRGRPPKKCIEV